MHNPTVWKQKAQLQQLRFFPLQQSMIHIHQFKQRTKVEVKCQSFLQLCSIFFVCAIDLSSFITCSVVHLTVSRRICFRLILQAIASKSCDFAQCLFCYFLLFSLLNQQTEVVSYIFPWSVSTPPKSAYAIIQLCQNSSPVTSNC